MAGSSAVSSRPSRPSSAIFRPKGMGADPGALGEDVAGAVDRSGCADRSTWRRNASLAPLIESGGIWSTSTELESGFGPSDWVSNVFVRLDDGVAYLSAKGE
jgi:hypothetical protein